MDVETVSETASTPLWYVVARLRLLKNAVPFVVSGPYPTNAEANLQRARQAEAMTETLEFTVADIRFPSDDPLLARLIGGSVDE